MDVLNKHEREANRLKETFEKNRLDKTYCFDVGRSLLPE